MGRAPCCDKNGLTKGPWTPEEDHKLVNYIQKHGYGNWRTLPKNAGLLRCGKSCRLRWSNYLRPDIKRGRFSFEEEETIIQLHSMLGNKWSAIAARLPGRTDNEIKNYWNTHIRKRLLRIGIDPVTHSPRLDLLDLSSLLSSTLYPNSSQMNLSNLLGLHPLLNPELLRIASSLFPSSHQSENNPNYCLQNVQQVPSNNIQTQNQAFLQNIETQFQDIPVAGRTQISPATQLVAEQVPSDYLANYNASTQSSDVEWLGNNNLSSYEGYLESEQNVVDLQTQNSKLAQYPYYYDSDFTFPTSVLSTPPSSPSHLNSNSTHFNCSSTTTEDERESQSSDMFKFEITDILDVEKFLS